MLKGEEVAEWRKIKGWSQMEYLDASVNDPKNPNITLASEAAIALNNGREWGSFNSLLSFAMAMYPMDFEERGADFLMKRALDKTCPACPK